MLKQFGHAFGTFSHEVDGSEVITKTITVSNFLILDRRNQVMRMLEEFFPEFSLKLSEMDELYTEKRLIDEKTYQFICFALSVKARSKPCVLKHFKGALEAGASVKELAYILALVMREAAGADDCWTHDVVGDWKEIIAGNVDCGCPK